MWDEPRNDHTSGGPRAALTRWASFVLPPWMWERDWTRNSPKVALVEPIGTNHGLMGWSALGLQPYHVMGHPPNAYSVPGTVSAVVWPMSPAGCVIRICVCVCVCMRVCVYECLCVSMPYQKRYQIRILTLPLICMRITIVSLWQLTYPTCTLVSSSVKWG